MINVAVIGVGGYTGLELIKMLAHHPKFKLTYSANTQGGVSLSSLHPSLKDVIEMDVNEVNIELISQHASLVFLALPHMASMKLVKPLLANGLRVIDLSADYR